MGSVRPDYRCPWCGRANGGYVLEGIGEFDPICTDGDDPCLELAIKPPHMRSKEEYLDYRQRLRELALAWVLLAQQGTTWPRILPRVARVRKLALGASWSCCVSHPL